jgi:CubicO group peptidase (beta-lactamase class C family)
VAELDLPRTAAVIERGITGGLQVGAQLAVSRGGVEGEIVLGLGAPGRAMARDTLLPWFSMTKVVTSLCALQQWERGAFGLDDRVASLVPEFGVKGKEAITVRHLLTHTAGIRFADGLEPGAVFSRDLDESVPVICGAPIEDGWVPGRRAGYHRSSGMAMLAEVVSRCDGRAFHDYAREEIFVPLGMDDCWIGMPADAQAARGDRIGVMHNSAAGEPRPMLGLNDPSVLSRTIPGAGGRGPMHELVRLYECLLGKGERDGVRLVSPQTVEAMTARHRVGMFDETFQAVIDWGLGLHIDMILMGRHCSPRAAGHGGAQSSVAFCDPEHGLAVAAVVNGMPGPAHHRRFEAIMTALYVDLGVATAEDAGRDHDVPRIAA